MTEEFENIRQISKEDYKKWNSKISRIKMDCLKDDLKSCHITYLSEFPSEDIKVEENTVIAVPGKKSGQINLYTWFEDKWVYTSTINKSDFDLKDLKDAYDDLENAIKKLTKISSNTENDELSSKLSKITTKILQAKYELADILESLN